MSMIQQIERLEQRTPSSVKSVVWGSLRIPHQVVRTRVIGEYLASHYVRKLQVGCGGNILAGWLNSDLNPVRSMGVYMANRRQSEARYDAAPHPLRDVIFVDATKRLPFRDRTFDYVFSEHMIEHIPFRDAMGLLNEIFRVLKPGGTLRLSTPDLAFLIDLSGAKKTDVQERYIAWATKTFMPGMQLLGDVADGDTFVINNFVRNWGHQFIYDQKTLWRALASNGFSQMKRCDPSESCDVNLRGIESHGRRIGDEFNQLESIVVEATKGA
jgi:predicted SAM-dependent methyltransferase